MHKLVLFS